MPLRSGVRGTVKAWVVGELRQVGFVGWVLGV